MNIRPLRNIGVALGIMLLLATGSSYGQSAMPAEIQPIASSDVLLGTALGTASGGGHDTCLYFLNVNDRTVKIQKSNQGKLSELDGLQCPAEPSDSLCKLGAYSNGAGCKYSGLKAELDDETTKLADLTTQYNWLKSHPPQRGDQTGPLETLKAYLDRAKADLASYEKTFLFLVIAFVLASVTWLASRNRFVRHQFNAFFGRGTAAKAEEGAEEEEEPPDPEKAEKFVRQVAEKLAEKLLNKSEGLAVKWAPDSDVYLSLRILGNNPSMAALLASVLSAEPRQSESGSPQDRVLELNSLLDGLTQRLAEQLKISLAAAIKSGGLASADALTGAVKNIQDAIANNVQSFNGLQALNKDGTTEAPPPAVPPAAPVRGPEAVVHGSAHAGLVVRPMSSPVLGNEPQPGGNVELGQSGFVATLTLQGSSAETSFVETEPPAAHEPIPPGITAVPDDGASNENLVDVALPVPPASTALAPADGMEKLAPQDQIGHAEPEATPTEHPGEQPQMSLALVGSVPETTSPAVHAGAQEAVATTMLDPLPPDAVRDGVLQTDLSELDAKPDILDDGYTRAVRALLRTLKLDRSESEIFQTVDDLLADPPSELRNMIWPEARAQRSRLARRVAATLQSLGVNYAAGGENLQQVLNDFVRHLLGSAAKVFVPKIGGGLEKGLHVRAVRMGQASGNRISEVIWAGLKHGEDVIYPAGVSCEPKGR